LKKYQVRLITIFEFAFCLFTKSKSINKQIQTQNTRKILSHLSHITTKTQKASSKKHYQTSLMCKEIGQLFRTEFAY
jgi:hypothetical protein